MRIRSKLTALGLCLLYRGRDYEFELRSKISLIHTAVLVSILFLTIFGTYALANGNRILGSVDLSVAMTLLLLDCFLLNAKHFSLICAIGITLYFGFFFYLMLSGGFDASGYIWSFTLPLYIVFLAGHRKGTLINTLYLALVMVFFFLDFPFPSDAYSADIKLRFCGAFFAIIALAGFLEYVLSKLREDVQQKNLALQSAVNDLECKEKTLRHSEQRLRDITLNSFDTLWEVDRDWKYVYISGRVDSVLGYSTEALIGKTPFSYMAADEVAKFQPFIDRAQSEKISLSDVERLCKHRNGSAVYLLTNAVPVLNDRGEVIGFRGVDKNITERKQAEKQRKILEEKLQLSRRMEAIGQLAGGIAHDFNNKLTTIIGCTEMMRNYLPLTAVEIERYRGTIEATARKSADLTAKLLAFARQGKYVITRVNLHDMVKDVIKVLKFSLGSDAIAIEAQLKAPSALIMGDLAQLQNALINLAVNAKDAMPQGGKLTFSSVNIELKAGQEKTQELQLAPGGYIQLSIADTGVGIDEKTRQRIFEPFFSVKPFGERVGLGLASTYGTIKSHNGSIEVESTVGKGATFILYLPLLPASPAATHDAAASRSKPAADGCIMVVDDEEPIRALTEELLRHCGYSVITAADGREALDVYRQRQRDISLIILDIVMPQLGGHDCFIELKKINPNVKVIVSSGYSIEGEATRIMKDGALAFLQKPYSLKELKELLQRWV